MALESASLPVPESTYLLNPEIPRVPRPANLLIVDDIAQNLVALRALLARPGVEVLAASSGAEALELLLAHDVALALLDVQMPQMDGFELAELMRGAERTRRVPIVFLTASASDPRRTFRGYEAGAVDFLHKPIDPQALRSKVDVFVALHEQAQRQAEQLETLREALRLNETFIAVLSHDLRNPLAAVVNGSELLLRASDEPLVKETAQRIRQSGARMARMIEQLLDVAGAQAGRLDARPVPGDLLDVCAAICDELRASNPDCEIVLSHTGDLRGLWDADRLSQALSNLVGNALHHGQADCPVRVEADGSSAHEVRLRVHNAGSIDAAVLPHLFEPFHTSRPRHGGAGGLGLGLHIVDRIVRGHGGGVTARSDPDSGTTFEIVLPRSSGPRPA